MKGQANEAEKLRDFRCICDSGMYSISITVKDFTRTSQLRDELRAAYDGGAAGLFEITEIDQSTKRIDFERNFGEDYEMLEERVAKGCSMHQAACEQLADELVKLNPEVTSLATVIGALRDPNVATVFGLVEAPRELQILPGSTACSVGAAPEALDTERISACVFGTGISYADKGRREHGDFARLAFLHFDTLELKIEESCPAQFQAEIIRDAAVIQARRGEVYQVSTVGQTVTLGYRLKPDQQPSTRSSGN